MFNIFKRAGVSAKERRINDYQNAKGAIKKGEKLTDRDRKMIAVGRVQVHSENREHARYRAGKEPTDFAKAQNAKIEAWKAKQGKKTKGKN